MSRWTTPRLHDKPAARFDKAGAKAPLQTQAPTAELLTLGDLPADCDPYLRWAVLTRWRGFVRSAQWDASRGDEALAAQRVRIIMQAEDPQDFATLAGLVEMPALYSKAIPDTTAMSRYATGSLAIAQLAQLLQDHPGLRWELSAPLKDQRAGEPGSAKGYLGQQADLSEEFRTSVLRKAVVRSPVRVDANTSGILAVIDFGCPFLHQRFGDTPDRASRMVALWDQGGVQPDEPWGEPAATGYGRELGTDVLRKAWTEVRQPHFTFPEDRVYSGLNYLIDYQDPRRRVMLATHGAHVLDVAGGVTDVVTGAEDAASAAQLVFVQLPQDTAGDSSGGSLAAHLLDALRYVLQVAAPAAPLAVKGAPMAVNVRPLVVNVSYGSTAGPHDGSSIIEQAMDELLLHRPHHFAIVLAAGNSRCSGLHVRRQALPARNALFRIGVVAGDSTDSFVEFWYHDPDQRGLQFRARLPGGEWSPWLPPDASVDLYDSSTGDAVAALIHQTRVPNGKRCLALLALRPTEAPDDDDASLAEPGLWEVEAGLRVSDGSEASEASEATRAGPAVTIDAWVERDDQRPFSGRKQTSFVGLEPTDADDTLSSIATGRHTVVVGGFRGSDGLEVPYSSTGPRSPAQWPLLHALCERDSLDAGLRAAAVRSGETLLMNGTSVAAPVMARHIYGAFHAAWKNQGLLAREALFSELVDMARRRGAAIRAEEAPRAAGSPAAADETTALADRAAAA